MRIRMLSTAAGTVGVHSAGQVVEVDDETALAWLNGGYAERAAGYETAVEIAVWMPDRLTAIKGIGHRTQEALYAANVRTFQQLIEADAEAVAAALDGSSVAQVRKWQADAVGFLG